MEDKKPPLLLDALRRAVVAEQDLTRQAQDERDPELAWRQLHTEIGELAGHVARAAQAQGVPFDTEQGHKSDAYTVEIGSESQPLDTSDPHKLAFRISPHGCAFERRHDESPHSTGDGGASDHTVPVWKPVPISDMHPLAAAGDTFNEDGQERRVIFVGPIDMQIEEVRAFLVEALGRFVVGRQLDV